MPLDPQSPKETVDFVASLYGSRPELYEKALVSTFFPHLAYLIRQRDPRIVMAMAWRPYFLSFEGWSGVAPGVSHVQCSSIISGPGLH